MPVISASAPGKAILFGEHAVVYNRPAIAVPVNQVKAKAYVQANPQGQAGDVIIEAPDIKLVSRLKDLAVDHPLVIAIQGVQEMLGINRLPALKIRVTSSIPIAAGFGSGAAVSVAIVRAFSIFLGHPLENEQVSALAYRVDQVHHGTPSGIDNTVITYAQPIYFIRNQPFIALKVTAPNNSTKSDTPIPAFTFVIGDTGIQSPTVKAVSDVRLRWQDDPSSYEAKFDAIAQIVTEARHAIEQGHFENLGQLMTQNHLLLQEIDVSCLELDLLFETAIKAGAAGAKLSGGGRGGNVIALTETKKADIIASAFEKAGATRTIITHIYPTQ